MHENNLITSFLSELKREPKARRDNSFPLISIVVPSYNQGEFLERTILSVLNQDYPNVELIIIDGGSTDNTLEIIHKYNVFISHWVSEKDKGQSHAVNKGFRKATGDIFGWQNSDDIYLPGAFRHAAAVFAENPQKTVLYGNWFTIDEHDSVLESHFALPAKTPHFPSENMDSYNQTMFWRKDAHRRTEGLDENLSRLMDNDLILSLLLKETPRKFFRSDKFIGAFRIHASQKTDMAKVDHLHLKEEMYLEEKYGFNRRGTFGSVYYRIVYRFFQLFFGLRSGGFSYVWRKGITGMRRKGGLL